MSIVKNSIAIRTHYINENIEQLVDRLGKVFGVHNVYVICDATSLSFKQYHGNLNNILYIYPEDLDRLGLHNFKRWGWQCGDYFYYEFASQVKSDFYWLIEPDVAFGDFDLSQLFNDVNTDSSDFIAVGHGLRSPSWYWSKSLEFTALKIYGCLYPLTRISMQAVNFLHEKRVEFSKLINDFEFKNWPNDEGFTSTLLEGHDFVCKDMKKCTSVKFDKFTTTIPLLKCIGIDDGISHPVLEWEEFLEKFTEKSIRYYKGGVWDVSILKKSLSNLTPEQIIIVLDKILLRFN